MALIDFEYVQCNRRIQRYTTCGSFSGYSCVRPFGHTGQHKPTLDREDVEFLKQLYGERDGQQATTKEGR